MNEKKTSGLEEALMLMDDIKDPKIKLDRKINGLLEANGYDILKENRNKSITIYCKRESTEVFIKYGSNDYCFAMLKEEKPVVDNIEDFYKKFKRTSERPLLIPICAGLCGTTISGGIGSYYLLGEFLGGGGPAVLGGILASVIIGTCFMVYLAEYLEKRNEKRLEESCKELYYGREALEKAFRR